MADRAYASYRRELLSASVPWTAVAVTGVTLLFQLSVAVAAPDRFRAEWVPNLIQLAVPLLAWLAFLGPWRAHPVGVMQCAEIVYTASLIGRLELATTSTSGTSLYVAVKMLATALLVPWGVRVQSISVALTMAMLIGAMALLRPDEAARGAATHVLLGPCIAGLLSIAGAAAADRVRRAVFDRERALAASTADLQDRAAVDEALARVARELIALPDTKRILDRLCHLTSEALQCDASHTYLWDADHRELRAAAGYGDTAEQWETLRVVAYPENMVRDFERRIAREGVIQYRVEDLSGPPSALWRDLGTTVLLCMALRRGDGLIGVQAAEYRGRSDLFAPRALRIAQGIAHLASLALETARLVEELDGANRLKSEFVATMSHELRSPLNIIIGYHELLLDGAFGSLTDRQRDPLRRADRSARELLDLISATLDLSRLEAKRIAVDVSDVAIAELVDEVGREYATGLDRPGLALRWFTGHGLPVLRTDRVKLKMVLKNLVGNAVKFTDTGEVSLSASARDGGIEFAIVDTGVGIPRDAQGMIFEPFRQLEVTRTRLRGGAGLGLYIVKRLLDALGGTISLESEVGRGSVFRVWLPLEAAAPMAGTAAAAAP
ncbi:GAF domain-containing sensor histidine kinase [bacterium]|nr:GAF domain-containing sensor histidine kinase [bacterium]